MNDSIIIFKPIAYMKCACLLKKRMRRGIRWVIISFEQKLKTPNFAINKKELYVRIFIEIFKTGYRVILALC